MGETLYLLANASVMPVWAAMIVAPGSKLTEKLVATPLVPLVYGVVYGALFLGTQVVGGEGGMGSMAALRLAFERDAVLLMAWIHYLCFDMVVGMWVFRDARRHELSWWAVGPCLFGTLMAGPFGFAAYLALRRAKTGAWSWEP